MDNKFLLKKIKNTRLVKELSQEEMAKRLHISTPTYSRFERGLTKTNINLLRNVSKILDLDFFNPSADGNNCFDIVKEDFVGYERKTDAIQRQLEELILLVENQQKTNKIILEKLKKLKSKNE